MPFLLHRDHFVGNRYADLAPSRKPSTGCIYPASFPHDLQLRPDLGGEAIVHKALTAALPGDWQAFYNCSVKGARRKIDFLLIAPRRGLIAIEVKGGLVHASRGSFRQGTHSLQGQRTHRKRIAPFAQVKLALAQLWDKSGIAPGTIPTFIMAAFPTMSEAAYPWGSATHVLTREDFDDAVRLARRFLEVVPVVTGELTELGKLQQALIANASKPRKARRKP